MPTKPMNPAASHERAHGEESVEEPERNPGVPLDLDWIDAVQADPAVVERRVAELSARRAPSDRKRTEELLRAVTLLDLTTLSGDDTPETVRRLCDRARRPLRAELLAQLGAGQPEPHVAAVCVYHAFVETAVEALRGTGIPVAAVSAGFPAGLSPLPQRIGEIRASVEAGAREIDVVITRMHALTGNWQALYDELRAFREACGPARMKVILATGELGTFSTIARASLVAMMAGADFVKTSTGKEAVNATLPVGLVICRAIREYHERTGYRVGFKPAGGIRTADQALAWLDLVHDELGDAWLRPERFRFGASSLLDDIECELENVASGHAPAAVEKAEADVPDVPSRSVSTVRVRYAETDQMGVVYHANYLVWCEIGRTDFIRGLGTTYAELEDEGLILAVADAQLRYHRAARYDDLIRIETWIERVQSRTVTFGYEIVREEPGPAERLASATTRLIGLDDHGAPRTLPPDLLEVFRHVAKKKR